MSQLRIRNSADPARRVPLPPRGGRERARPLAVFDLDGTLVDTAPDLTASLNHCLGRAGLGEVSVETVRPHAGKGVRVMLERAYEAGGLRLHGAAMEEQIRCFLAHYEAHIADRSTLYPGAIEALDRLAGGGISLAICTNKTEALSHLLVEALGLDTRFGAICGSDSFAHRKPHPDHLLGTIARAGGRPEATVMVGDTITDMDAGSAAGVPAILVGFGYEADETARRAANRIIASFNELDAALIEQLFVARHSAG